MKSRLRASTGRRLRLAVLILSAPLLGQDTTPLQRLSDFLVQTSETINPAVVLVVSSGYQVVTRSTQSATEVYAQQQNAGSGVILSEDGYIVTNAHVVQGASRVSVQLSSEHTAQGQSVLQRAGPRMAARVVGLDRETDLALLKVEATGLPFLELADSDQVRQGQLVFAVGSPAGLQSSLTMGIISAVARQLEPEGRVVYLQTDTPINPGNSGGPLIDLEGQVVGINTLIVSQGGGSEGLGFAIPSNIVKFVVDRLKTTGVVVRGDIGVVAQTITPTLAMRLGLPVETGVILGDVLPASTASLAGLKPGDIILTMNGKPMENARQFYVNLYQQEFSSIVTLDLLRGAEKLSERVVVLDRKDSLERLSLLVNERQNLVERLSILAFEMDAKLSGELPFAPRRSEGIVVARLVLTSSGPSGDLLPGDVIYTINAQPVSTLDQVAQLLEPLSAGETVVLQIERGGRLQFLEFMLE